MKPSEHKTVQESFEQRQITTAEALEDLPVEVGRNEERKRQQAEKGFDAALRELRKKVTFAIYAASEDLDFNRPSCQPSSKSNPVSSLRGGEDFL